MKRIQTSDRPLWAVQVQISLPKRGHKSYNSVPRGLAEVPWRAACPIQCEPLAPETGFILTDAAALIFDQ